MKISELFTCFLPENFRFLEVKFSIYLNRRVFIMSYLLSCHHMSRKVIKTYLRLTKTQINMRIRIRVFIVGMKKLHPWRSKYAQWRFWSDCANQNLPWVHMFEGTFSEIAAHIVNNTNIHWEILYIITLIFFNVYRLHRNIGWHLLEIMYKHVEGFDK